MTDQQQDEVLQGLADFIRRHDVDAVDLLIGLVVVGMIDPWGLVKLLAALIRLKIQRISSLFGGGVHV